MFTPDQYQLIDFGDGRRLERFAGLRLDRPCPAVEDVARADPDAWDEVDARFERGDGEEGRWSCRGELPECWSITHGPITLELRRTAFGHLGVFPEQAANWDWITERLAQSPRPAKVLNLFAYTGGSTLAAAACGAEVVHVDAARNTIDRARRNAELSGMAERPIRWIAEDAMKFVKRELKRGNRYDAVILDPPSYGHGPRGEVWRLSTHLPRLLRLCGELTAGRRGFMLLTCHTPGYDPPRLKEIMADALGEAERGTVAAGESTIRAATGRPLPGGAVVRWESRLADGLARR
ncbi:MAG TPA: class I SAM-dependent methyltransferase [Thermoguttaceae bacterium]|nr:class I SAM-dependent methyltransferase [Thermoguttaceae bacterium]